MEKTLVVLAAGMGSRFGGLKQITPVGPNGEFIIDYSIYDAIKYGFTKVVFVIRKNNYVDFKNTIGKRIEDKIKVEYAFQELDVLPIKKEINREKALGTAHAVYCAKDYIKEPFALISSDDFYGQRSYKLLSDFIDNYEGIGVVGYKVASTIIDDETVKRAIIFDNHKIIRKTMECSVHKDNEKVYCTPLNGMKSFEVELNKMASMLMFVFNKKNFFEILEKELIDFLNTADLSKDEFLLPDVINSLVKDKDVQLLESNETWMGMTYKEDKEKVENKIKEYINNNIYNDNLWG